MIPEDWALKEKEFNLILYLTQVYDHLLTVEENSKIAKSLSGME
jgi:hypothetical protein